MSKDQVIAPFELSEDDDEPGSYCLILDDFYMTSVKDVFEQHGQQSDGYAWNGVARSVVVRHAPELAGKLVLDSESHLFCAYSQDRGALEWLGALLADALNRPERLGELIRSGEPRTPVNL